MTRSSTGRFLLLVLTCIIVTAAANAAHAQDFRATVNGRITDTSGAAVPNATVTIRNPQTNESSTATTSEDGNYTLPFLQPGTYTVTVEAAGFKRTTQEQLVLQVSQAATVDIQLEIGQVTETVTVTADLAVLEETKADRGLVIDNARVTELPLNARNPFMLSILAPGITYNGPAIYQRPFDNGAIADWSINGGQNRNNEFLLDGAPNNAIQGGNNIAYVPPVDAVSEFKIVTNQYDSQYGRSAGGTVNVQTKSGTNDVHGTVYEFLRRRWLDSNFLAFKAQNAPPNPPEGLPKPGHYLDQYGFEIDGPVMLPGFGEGGPAFSYDGRDRTFFMFTYEGYREGTPNPASLTYPDARQRLGDFSQLRNASGELIQIYDPLTGTNGTNRTPFPGNIIPANRIDQNAQRLLNFYPLPNSAPPAGTDPWRNNYFFAPNLAADDFYNTIFKIDHNFNQNNRMFFRYGYNKRTEQRVFNGIVGNPAEDSQGPLERINYTGVLDFVSTLSPTSILNLRVSANRYIEAARTEIALGFDPATLGFPASFANNLSIQFFPRFNFFAAGTSGTQDYQNLGRGGFNREPTNVYGFQPNMTLIRGNHTIRFGLDARHTQYAQLFSGRASGEFNFNRNFTRRNFNSDDNPGRGAGIAALTGNSIASFLLGAPDNVFVENNVFPIFIWKYYAPWVQDDWRVSNRLTLNLGVRWDFNSPPKERYNRLNFGFDPNAVNPASSRLPGGLQVRGGLNFAGVGGNPEYLYRWDYNNIQPRLGFAYRINDKTVMRAGIGQYYVNPTSVGQRQGFSLRSDAIVGTGGGQTSFFNFSNPFPNGISQPLGSAAGLETFLGRSPTFYDTEFRIPYVWQYSFGFQRELPFGATVDVSYVGSRTYDEQTPGPGGTIGPNNAYAYNEPSVAFRNQCDVTRGGNPAFCDQQLPNPFRGVAGFEGTNRFTDATLSRYELNRPFPQFSAFNQEGRNDGRIWYDSLQVSAQKRFSKGVSFQASYTFSKMIEQNGYIDGVAKTLSKSLYGADRPHRFTASSVYQLPFGTGRAFFSGANRFANSIVGGWELGGLFVRQSGRPWELPGNTNLEYVRDGSNPDPERFRGNNNQYDPSNYITGVAPCVALRNSTTGALTLQPYSVAVGCTEPNFIVRNTYEERTTPYRIDGVRRQAYTQFDVNLAKRFRFTERVNLQLRGEFFNVTNTPMYDEINYVTNPDDANFGRINKTQQRQSNFPRFIQLGVKFNF